MHIIFFKWKDKISHILTNTFLPELNIARRMALDVELMNKNVRMKAETINATHTFQNK